PPSSFPRRVPAPLRCARARAAAAGRGAQRRGPPGGSRRCSPGTRSRSRLGCPGGRAAGGGSRDRGPRRCGRETPRPLGGPSSSYPHRVGEGRPSTRGGMRHGPPGATSARTPRKAIPSVILTTCNRPRMGRTLARGARVPPSKQVRRARPPSGLGGGRAHGQRHLLRQTEHAHVVVSVLDPIPPLHLLRGRAQTAHQPGEGEELQQVVRHVDLPPEESLAGGRLVVVMVVVPP